MPSIAFIGAHDSEFKWSSLASKRFIDAGWDVSYQTVDDDFLATPDQVQDAGVNFSLLRILTLPEALDTWSRQDAVVFATNGDLCEKYLLHLRHFVRSAPRRPIMIAAYCGVVITNHLAGYAARCAADIVCVNSQHDFDLFERAAIELGLSADSLTLTGLAILPPALKAPKEGAIRTVVYADQAVVPQARLDRHYIYARLVQYAMTYPERRVLVKPRYRPWETSYKKSQYPPEAYFSKTANIPDNLSLTYTPISLLLPSIDLLITISSTAALEAVYEGCRVALVADIGLRETFGSPMFVGSQLLRTFDQIVRDDIRHMSPAWLEYHAIEKPNALVERVTELFQQGMNEAPPADSPYIAARRDILFARSGHRSTNGSDKKRKAEKAAAPQSLTRKLMKAAKRRLKDNFPEATRAYRSLKRMVR